MPGLCFSVFHSAIPSIPFLSRRFRGGDACGTSTRRHSALITFECGEFDQLAAVTEPSINRPCEIRARFVTPAACSVSSLAHRLDELREAAEGAGLAFAPSEGVLALLLPS